jgi:PDZ domain-containing protein
MRDNSLDIATMVAYKRAGKEIEVKYKQNIVIATTKDNGLKIGDIILSVDDILCEEVSDIKKIIKSKEVGEKINFKILRNNKEQKIESKILLENNAKVIGVVIVTEYDYDLDPEIDIRFKSSESGASGGLMLTLTIYNAISGEDIIKGRNISGTGTISSDGSVGEIDGVKYKIMGAAKNNMDIAFVPSNNYDEAIETKEKYNYDIEIIKVDTFDEALEFLKNN